MKKILLAAIAATAFSSAFAAPTTGSGNLILNASATKKAEPVLEITAADRNVEFLYIWSKGQFETRTKPFTVSLKNGPLQADLKNQKFVLSASVERNTLINRADQSTMDVEVNIGTAKLSKTPVKIVDGDAGTSLLKTEFVAGSKGTKRTEADGELTLSLVNAKDANGAAIPDVSAMEAGVWTGDIDLKFTTSWGV